jgi:hypothetical protein
MLQQVTSCGWGSGETGYEVSFALEELVSEVGIVVAEAEDKLLFSDE